MMLQKNHGKDLTQARKANDPLAYNFEVSFTLPHSFHYYVNIVEEGAKEVNKRLVPNFSIEGWKFTAEPLMTAEEALPMLGL
jgi:hypothetical protein